MNRIDPAVDYLLGRSESETRRLILQARIYGPITRSFFEAAGIGPGMKVLDIGSGAGDVALLLADRVGLRGSVTGVDLDAAILDTARRRVATAGWSNVRFLEGDARRLELDDDFDAVVGRWVLMYQPEPAQVIRDFARRLHPGGIVAFQENDLTAPPPSWPVTPLMRQVYEWSLPPTGMGVEIAMGPRLRQTYLDAGLPEPELVMAAPIGGGASWPGYQYIADTVRSVLPKAEKRGMVKPGQVDPDTLADRLRDESVAMGAVHALPPLIGAWSRRT